MSREPAAVARSRAPADRASLAAKRVAGPLYFVLLGTALFVIPGCALFVMGGRMLMGDTKMTSQFKKYTHVDLVKAHRKLLVLVTASDDVKMNYPTVDVDIQEGVTHRLKVAGITKLVNTDDVAGWLDEHGGRVDDDDLKELTTHFQAEYLVHISVLKFDCHEENSPDLLRGRSEGHVQAFHLEDDGPKSSLPEVMASDYVSTYPQGNPVSIDKKSAKNFQQEYVDRIALQLSQIFYDHPPAEEMQ